MTWRGAAAYGVGRGIKLWFRMGRTTDYESEEHSRGGASVVTICCGDGLRAFRGLLFRQALTVSFLDADDSVWLRGRARPET